LQTCGEAKTQRDSVDAFVWLSPLGSRRQSASVMLAQTQKMYDIFPDKTCDSKRILTFQSVFDVLFG